MKNQFKESLYSLIIVWLIMLAGIGIGNIIAVILSVVALVFCIVIGLNILMAQCPERENVRMAVIVLLLWGITIIYLVLYLFRYFVFGTG